MMNETFKHIVRLEQLNNETKETIKSWLNKSVFTEDSSRYLQKTRLHTYPRFDTIFKIIQEQEKRIIELENKLSKILDEKQNPKTNYKVNPLFDSSVIPKGGYEFLEAYIGQSPTNNL